MFIICGGITCLNNFSLVFNSNFIIYEVIARISFIFVHVCVYFYSFLQQTELICSAFFFFFNWWDDPLNYSCKVVLFSCFSNKLIEPHPYSGIMIFTDWVSLSRSNPHLIAHVFFSFVIELFFLLVLYTSFFSSLVDSNKTTLTNHFESTEPL